MGGVFMNVGVLDSSTGGYAPYQQLLIKIRASIRKTEQTSRKQGLVVGLTLRERFFLVLGCRCGSQSGTIWQRSWQTTDSPVTVVLVSSLRPGESIGGGCRPVCAPKRRRAAWRAAAISPAVSSSGIS